MRMKLRGVLGVAVILATAAIIVLRKKRPDMPRPYRAVGYPVVPVLFVVMAFCIVASALYNSPRESGMGLVLILAGGPFYLYWRRRNPQGKT